MLCFSSSASSVGSTFSAASCAFPSSYCSTSPRQIRASFRTCAKWPDFFQHSISVVNPPFFTKQLNTRSFFATTICTNCSALHTTSHFSLLSSFVQRSIARSEAEKQLDSMRKVTPEGTSARSEKSSMMLQTSEEREIWMMRTVSMFARIPLLRMETRDCGPICATRTRMCVMQSQMEAEEE